MTVPSKSIPREAEPFLRNNPHLNRPHAPCADPENLSAQAPIENPITPWVSDQLNLPQPIMDQLEAHAAWSLLVIKQDQLTDAGPSELLHQAIMQVIESKAPPFWGAHWKDNLYVALLPNSDLASAEHQAHNLQSELAQDRPETISIGISAFPLLDFNPAQTVGNGGKALDHAAFFGPGSCMVFDAVSLNISGDQYYQAGDMDRAVTEYRAAIQMDPTNANVLNSLGVCLGRNGDLKGAQKLFTAAWKNDGNEAMAIYNLAIIALIDGAPEKALPLLKQAVVLNHECFDIPFRLGKLLYEQNAHQDAIPHLNDAIALHLESASAYYYLGECLARTAQPKAAIAALGRAIKLNPNDAAALSLFGVLYAACDENPDICETFFQQSIDLAPENGTFHHRLGRFYQRQSQWKKAQTAFENAKALGHNCSRQLSQVRQHLHAREDRNVHCA